jgi:translation initiation factor IF-2
MANQNEKTIIEVPEYLSVRELATLISVSPIEVMKQLIKNGLMKTINDQIDYDTAAIVVEDMGFEARPVIAVVEEDENLEDLPEWRRVLAGEDQKSLQRRPPVVTILGHVDHGKTSLLDAIRNANVAAGESGGITQHIGAYQVMHNKQKITFLDTPGHEAFTSMRARGAQGADIAVLVVAADDGVMDTTKEAISHARAAHVPIVVALNKIDKRNANPEFVKQQLSDMGLVPDDWGGNTMVVPVSARDKTGIDDLLEAIVLTAEDAPILANPKGKVFGTVLEATMDKGKGVLATLLVQNGTLKAGDYVIVGNAFGRIRAMFDEKGKQIKDAPPSTPARIMGLNEVPSAGDSFIVLKNEKEARAIIEARNAAAADANAGGRAPMSMEEIFAKFRAGEAKELRIILKVDVQGSLEPSMNELNSLATTGLALKILHAAAGTISENDVKLAISTGSVVIGFRVDADNAAQRVAEANSVDIRRYDVIYEMKDEVEKALKGLLDPVYQDRVIGTAEVRQVFRIPSIGKIAGCIVREGEIRRNAKVRVRRGRETLAEGLSVGSLKREKDDVREVRAGLECGIAVDGFDAFNPGDMIEFMVRERVS